MTELFAFVAIALVALLLFALPFVPSLMELRRPESVGPLSIPPEHDGDIRHFARRFRAFVASEVPKAPGESTAEHAVRTGTLRAFIAQAPLVVDHDCVIPGDVYAKHCVYGWDDAVYRGLLSDGNVALGRRSQVLRWIHGARDLRIGAGSALLGRASADGVLRVETDTSFEWLSAPRIEFGAPGSSLLSRARGDAPWSTDDVPLPRRVTGDLEIPPNSDVVEDLIATGSVRVGAGAVLRRSVKARGSIQIDDGVWVRGSVVSNTDVTIGGNSSIGGIVVAERSIRIGERTRVGAEVALSTVSAPRITMAPSSVAHGTVWARARGEVKQWRGRAEEAADISA